MTRRFNGKTSDATEMAKRSEHAAGQTRLAAATESKPPKRWPTVVVCALLGLAVWLVFGQTLSHEFVNYDNAIYVYENPNITAGLSLKGVIWAFTHLFVDQWCPVTAISHMLDCELYGLYAWGHHLTNVLLHIATVTFLFLVLRKMTGAFWCSAFVAAVFAIHPLRVESVAWVTERKDMLSGLFFVLTLWAYARYTGVKPEGNNANADSGSPASGLRPPVAKFYWLALLFFALGLLSKAMLVTMPFLLLLLDWWPLRRLERSTLRCVLLEKLPFLLLSAGGSMVTILTDKGVDSADVVGTSSQVANAVVAYVIYIKQMLHPAGLAVFYPHPENRLAAGTVATCALLLLVITVGVIIFARKRPWFLVGWLWYLGMLVPVIGLLQAGAQAHADRYTYLPQIGLYLLMAWTTAELCGRWWQCRTVLSVAAVAILLALGVRAHDQTKHWRNSISLWEHALAHTSGNYVAHFNLGSSLADRGKLEEAIAQYEKAIRIKPHYAEAHYNWGVALGAQGKLTEALPHYQRALEARPAYPDALNNLGNALLAQGKTDEAIQHYERALQLKPDLPEACYNIGNALTKQGKSKEAIERYEQALRLNPNYAEAHYNLGNRLAAQGKLDEAIRHFEQVIRIKPGYAEAYNNLGNKCAAQKKWDRAVQSFERALQLKPDYVEAHNNLGVTLAGQGKLDQAIYHYREANRIKRDYAEARANLGNALAMKGKTDEALEHLHEALSLATSQTNAALARAIFQRLESFQSPPPETKTP